jgi:phage-related protein
MMFLAANPVGLVLVALAAVVTAGILIWKNWDTISAKAKEIWGAIQGFLSETLGKIVGFFRDHWAKIVAILFPAVGLPILIAQNWGQIVGVVTDMFNKVKEVILFAFATVVGFVRDHWQKILAILFPPVGLPILIANNWGQIINVVNNILDSVKGAFQRAIDWIKGRISAFVDWVMGMLNKIKNVDVTPGFNVPGVPVFQHGGTMARAGLAMVGEAGPELVRLPRGARVFSNEQSRGMMGSALPVINLTINYSGDASPLELGRVLERGLRRVAREFPV